MAKEMTNVPHPQAHKEGLPSPEWGSVASLL
ncbi:hypothetical protein E2320_011350, partial [Naja naja]